jgi:hypothetical protein
MYLRGCQTRHFKHGGHKPPRTSALAMGLGLELRAVPRTGSYPLRKTRLRINSVQGIITKIVTTMPPTQPI